jgi:HEAT repeat protein
VVRTETSRFTRTREYAIDALGIWGGKETVPLLLSLLNESNPAAVVWRKAAMHALGSIKDERALEPLLGRLEDFSDRGDAANVLKKWGPAAEKAVLARLNHKDRTVRTTVCQILEVIGTQTSIPALEVLAMDENLYWRKTAENTIKAIRARQ